MQFITIIEKLSKDFIVSFNERDFVKVESLLASNFVIESDNIQKIYPNYPGNLIKGASEAITYWKKLVELVPDFRVDPTDHQIENHGKNILYSGHLLNGKPYYARFTISEYGKFECLAMSYPDSI